MFVIKNITKSFGDHMVLNDVSLSVNTGEVVALIGKNGVGKTTLLNIASGQISPDSGSVQVSGVGYVPQELDKRAKVRDLFGIGAEDWEIDMALQRVGLLNVDLSQAVGTLSGGQRTRLTFAAVLLKTPEPEVLLLDEPTNNLDGQMIDWLKKFIQSFRGGVLVVSHDRMFVYDVVQRIVELNKKGTREYDGNYDDYIRQKQIEELAKQKDYEHHVEKKRKLKKSASDLKNLASGSRKIRVTDNEKMRRNKKAESAQHTFARQAKAIESRLYQTEDVEKPDVQKILALNIKGNVHTGKLILRVNNLSINYGIKKVISNLELEVRGPQHVRVTGPNGSGKTTLFSALMGQVEPVTGEIVIGQGVIVGYFSQDDDGLDHTKSAIDNLNGIVASMSELRNWLYIMGIVGDDVSKLAGELSRGQRSKLGIIKLLAGNHQLIILDEPTNHLDIMTREYIESALEKYGGAILFASHDEYFASAIKYDSCLIIGSE